MLHQCQIGGVLYLCQSEISALGLWLALELSDRFLLIIFYYLILSFSVFYLFIFGLFYFYFLTVLTFLVQKDCWEQTGTNVGVQL